MTLNYDESPVKPKQEDTIINAYERLERDFNCLQEIAKLSEQLIEKLNRTEGKEKLLALDEQAPKKLVEQKNIVQLLNSVSEGISKQTDIIRMNLNNAISMIG